MGDSDWWGYRRAAWLGLVLTVAGALAAWGWGFTANALVALAGAVVVMLIITVTDVPALFDLLLVVTLLFDCGGWLWSHLQTVSWYDGPAHVLTTLSLTLVAAYTAFHTLFPVLRHHRRQLAFATLTCGLALGLVWEIADWAGLLLMAPLPEGIDDTMADLLMDGIGAVAAVPTMLWAVRQQVSKLASHGRDRRAA